MHPYDYCSIIYNSQNMKATHMSLDRWLDKEDMVYKHTHTMEYYSALKRGEIWDNMDGSIF